MPVIVTRQPALRAWAGALPAAPPMLGYTCCVILAVILAVYAAYALELASPFSAGTTVLIVVNPVRGAILSKSLFRLVGTLAGALAAVVLIAAFAQSPVLFLAGFAVWLGGCTALSNMLRHFRAYAAVLAGYTVALVAFGAVANPAGIFDLAMARVAVVAVGIASAALVLGIVSPGAAQPTLPDRFAEAVRAVARINLRAFSGASAEALRGDRAALIARIGALDMALEYAAAEQPDIAAAAPGLRQALAGLSGAVAGGATAAGSLAIAGGEQPALLEQVRSFFAQVEGGQAAGESLAACHVLRHALAAFAADAVLPHRIAADQANEVLSRMALGLHGLALLHGEAFSLPRRYRPATFQDPVPALRNGLRAALAVGVASVFWILTAWPSGGTMFAMLGPNCALLATAPSPARASLMFLYGTALSTITAFVAAYGVLPLISGFPLLAVAIAVFLAPGIWFSNHPRWGYIANSYGIFFMTQFGVTNPAHYALGAFLNTAFALNFGAMCAVLAFRVLLPPSAQNDVRRYRRAMLADLAMVATSSAPPDPLGWETAQQTRIMRIATRLPPGDPSLPACLDGGFVVLLIGRAMLRLRGSRPGAVPELGRMCMDTEGAIAFADSRARTWQAQNQIEAAASIAQVSALLRAYGHLLRLAPC